jgi:hypothetical protein
VPIRELLRQQSNGIPVLSKPLSALKIQCARMRRILDLVNWPKSSYQ